MKNSERYSFSTGALYPLESGDALKLIKDAGFPNAELMPQCLSDSSKESARRLERVGIRVASIHYPLAFFPLLYTAHRSMTSDGRRYSLELLSLGEHLGTEVLVVHPHIPSNKGYDALLDAPVVENLLWLAEECQRHGILMAMENSPKTCATPEQLLAYVAALNHPNIKPMVDTTEVREAGGDPAAFIAAVSPCHLHLSDYKGESKHLPAGEGDTDFSAVAGALSGYDGFYTLEPAYRYYIDNIEQKLRAGYAFLARTFPNTQ
ncbi:MAG: sugar phosphate isomerase/epimerase family protein [Clostridiaceae bacterium]